MPAVLGIDPGNTGAIALVDDPGRLWHVGDMPVVDGWVSPVLLLSEIDRLIDRAPRGVDLAVVEKTHSMPGQGVAGVYKFGFAHGCAVCAVATLPNEHPAPGTWKRAMGLVGKGKDASRRLAIDLWPEHADKFARKKDDGRAEACLLAEYGRRLLAERSVA